MPEIEPLPSIDSYQEVVDRSLFAWNRRPKLGDDESSEALGEVESRWQLTGVVNTGNTLYAIFNELEGERRLSLETGMYLEKWQIQDISPETVVLTRAAPTHPSRS